MALAAGQSVRFRYRIVIHAGDTKSAGVDALWKRYTGK
jgi:hypothetical protein